MQKQTLGAVSLALNALTVAADPFPIFYRDSSSYGPDGPWNHIMLNVGNNPISTIDFYPLFGDGGNLLVTRDACETNKAAAPCLSPTPNYLDPVSDVLTNRSMDHTAVAMDDTYWKHSYAQLNLDGDGTWSTAQIHNPTTLNDTLSYVSSNITQGVGSMRYTPISLLSVEPSAARLAQTSDARDASQTTLLQAYHDVYNGRNSLGLHVGSAKFNQSGSLYLGGFDQNRMIEAPAVSGAHGDQNISAISLTSTNASDPSPWVQASRGRKPPGNLLNSTLTASLSPQVPNLLLPRELCQSLASYLPVTYDSTTNLYLWNTADELYKRLTTSTAYRLDFTFTPDNAASTTIKVPFALLDLTLAAPIKKTPTAYFPCEARADGLTHLGRAFLQSAMVMQTWGPDHTLVGQAPGPAVNQTWKANVQELDGGFVGVVNAAKDAMRWEDTWAGFIAVDKSTGTSTTSSSETATSAPSSASTGAAPAQQKLTPGGIVGIAVGCVGGAAFVAGIIWLDLRRQRGKAPEQQNGREGNRGAAMDAREPSASASPTQEVPVIHRQPNGFFKHEDHGGAALKQYMEYATAPTRRPGTFTAWPDLEVNRPEISCQPGRPVRPPRPSEVPSELSSSFPSHLARFEVYRGI